MFSATIKTRIISFQWTSTLQDGTDLYSCVGDSIKLPWDYSVQDGEVVEDIKWYFKPGNDSRRVIATVVEGNFLPLRTSFSDRIHPVLQAGLTLMFVTGQDSGEFSVSVSIVQGTSFAVYNQTALLVVAEDPLVYGAESLSARQERVAVYDNKTGQLHVQLSCGGYVIIGHPPLSVEWTFPSGEKHLTSIHINGFFIINLPNPVEGGSYTVSPVVPVTSGLVFTPKRKRTQEFIGECGRELDSNKVLFEARLSRDQSVYRDRVILDRVITNEGNAYNSSTGEFTAPFNGTYFFFMTVYNQGSTSSTIASVCDEVTCFCQVMSLSSTYYGACQAVRHLSTEDTVWLRSDRQGTLLSSFTSFSGFSVHPDIDLEV
ncbi:hypothetical protein C0Q70_21065 [Pomacea canaliculata]|uniref:C1q domain-containing protein n=1 Tax=Pomacea canaliculata TaxID=400727 RepID=A0A2T7NBG2_POMCA|nr:hypothetical protein C0Q70_21065 [Pomacea canaliculata]